MASGNIQIISESEDSDEDLDNTVVIKENQVAPKKDTENIRETPKFPNTSKTQDTTRNEDRGFLNKTNNDEIEKIIKYKTDYQCILLKSYFDGLKVANLKIHIEEETITLRGPRELVMQHSLSFLERLNSISVFSETISDSKHAILQKQGSIEELRKRARGLDENCHIFLDENKMELNCAAFSENKAKAAIGQAMALFDKVDISYSDHHLELFSSSSWSNVIEELQKSLMVVIEIVHSREVVEVEGLNDHVSKAEVKVREMVQNHKCLVSVTVTGAKARLIAKVSYFQDELKKAKEEAIQKQLTLGIEQGEETDRITFKYTEGAFLKKRIEGVLDSVKWVQVTASDVGKNAHDEEVITRCLNSEKGKHVLRNLETDYKVFIDLVPGKEVDVKVVQDSDPRNAMAERSTSVPDLRATEEEPLVVGATKLVVKRGSVLRERATTLVNVLHKGSRWKGILPKKFMHECRHIQREFECQYDDDGNMVVTEHSSGNLSRLCRYVCHIVLSAWERGGSSEQELQEAVRACLDHCMEQQVDSIAFPAVGAGKLLKYPVRVVARVLIKECVDWLKRSRHSNLKKIVFVVYEDDEKRVFDEELCRHRGGSPIRSGLSKMMSGLSKPFRRKSTKESEEVTCHTSTFHEQHLQIFGESAQSLKDSKKKIVKEIEASFLAKEIIPHKGGGKLSGEDKESILETTRQLSVILKIDFEGYVVIGHKDDVQALANKIRSLLLNRVTEVSARGHHRRQRWTGPRSRKGTKEYWEEVLQNPTTPLYWREFRGGHEIQYFLDNEENYCRVNEVDNETFKAISDLVEQTWDQTHVGHGKDAINLAHQRIHVKKIERVENIELFSNYSHQRNKIIRRMLRSGETSYPRLDTLTQNGGIQTTQKMAKLLNTSLYLDINEHYAFHGTKSSYTENITKKGIDPRKSGDRLMFGQGIYCAENSIKADQYTDDKGKRQTKGLQMLLVRLLIGNPFVSGEKKNYRHPPCSVCKSTDCVIGEHAYYDSIVVEGSWLFREFVVYETNNCYPEYIITYDRL